MCNIYRESPDIIYRFCFDNINLIPIFYQQMQMQIEKQNSFLLLEIFAFECLIKLPILGGNVP